MGCASVLTQAGHHSASLHPDFVRWWGRTPPWNWHTCQLDSEWGCRPVLAGTNQLHTLTDPKIAPLLTGPVLPCAAFRPGTVPGAVWFTVTGPSLGPGTVPPQEVCPRCPTAP